MTKTVSYSNDGAPTIFLEKGKYGIKNSSGEIIIPAEYKSIKRVNEYTSNGKLIRQYVVELKKKQGLLQVNDNSYEVIIPIMYDSIEKAFKSHFKDIMTYDPVDKEFKMVDDSDTPDNLDNFSDVEGMKDWEFLNLYLVSLKKKYGLIDTNGNTRIPVEYEKIGWAEKNFPYLHIYNEMPNGDFWVEVKTKKGTSFLDSYGNTITQHLSF
ncbi:hypothetical protein M2480_002975 [Parabacteroides sp. PFB2-12]|uniref:WG repeat-containing protein n=1 Tax=unclassified Parabacteroides TaxID=2649774 RepID=UPI0024772A36|nr:MULTISPECIES: WG repeat-containing protein [unclassified Parabacteroides]MDH6343437.1 hypothetical protein [Parabacteroides sp. PM6-13]MDH6391971.1 hypothetical protein [Parabacteroides sp. PFB2-12]